MKKLIAAMLAAATVTAPVASYAVPTPQGYVYNDYGCVVLSTDGTDATVLQYLGDIAPGDTVYYRVSADDGYYCSSLKINAVSAGEGAFIMPEGELVIEAKYGIRGDANNDNKLNLTDVTKIVQSIVSYAGAYWTINRNAADYNRDGRVNLSDAAVILRKLAGMEEGGKIKSDSGYFLTLLADVSLTGYMLTDSDVLPDGGIKGGGQVGDLIREPITSTDELLSLTDTLMSYSTEVSTVIDGYTLEPTKLNLLSFAELYTEEFFEEYDIIPIVVMSHRIFTVDEVWDTESNHYRYNLICTAGEKIGGEIVWDDGDVDYYGECFLYLAEVPKGEFGKFELTFTEDIPEFLFYGYFGF